MSPPRLVALVRALLAATALALIVSASAQAAPFSAGNVVIYRVGDGTAMLSNTGSAVFLDEYTPTGTLVQSVLVPPTGADSTIASGTATSEGLLTRSVDGRFLTFTGYNRALGGMGSVVSTTSTAVPRVVGRADSSGNLDLSTKLTDFSSGNNPRSAVSTNGTDLWVTGAANTGPTVGVRFTTLGSTTSTQLTTTTNFRQVNIFDGQLYVSSASGATRIATVGTGLPTTPGQPVTNIPGAPASLPSPYGFFFADLDGGVAGVDTLYVADDAAGALQKFSLVSGTWVSNGTIGVDSDDYRGLTATVSDAGVVTLYATRRGNQLVTLTDVTGYNGAFTGVPVPLATAGTNQAFRGVALTPAAPRAPDSCDDPGVIQGTPGNDTIQGTEGDDFICGGGGNDTILDKGGDDQVFGEEGNDVLGAGTGADDYSGGSGQDRVSYATRTQPVRADIGTAGNGEFNGETNEADTIDSDVEDLNGGSGADELIGDDDANTLTGGPGEGVDAINGNGGPDRLRGGGGNDGVIGGTGNDTIEGQTGNDELDDGEGADLLLGGDQNDTLTLTQDGERDEANCGAGTDTAIPQEPVDRANRNCETRS